MPDSSPAAPVAELRLRPLEEPAGRGHRRSVRPGRAGEAPEEASGGPQESGSAA